MKVDIIKKAEGKWFGILAHFGIDKSYLKKKHGPCPVCGGKDRFIFDDKEGRGTFYCNSCGAGTGAQLLSNFKGWSMSETLREVNKIVGGVQKTEIKPDMTDAQKRKAMNDLWQSSIDPRPDDPVFKYLNKRCGIDIIPFAIRYHPNVYHSETKSSLPCMVSKVTAYDNKPIAIHRTYLTAMGEKQKFALPNKKLMGIMPEGSAIRLGAYTDKIGIAEGIETALTCTVCFGIPTWAAVNAPMMAKWLPPENVEKVYIFADNDRTFTGQLSAFKLAWRLEREFPSKYKIRVICPEATGSDWNDLYLLLGRDGVRDLVNM